MKRNTKRLPALLLAIILCLSLLPVTALAANFPSMFYASVTYKYESNTKYEIFGTVTQSADTLTYSRTGEKMDRVVYGMEYAGGVFFTVEGNKLPRNEDDGLRELRMYNSDLSSYRTIGEVNQEGGGYWIVDTAMDLSGEEPALYGTYNTVIPDVVAMSVICTIDLETATPGNYLQVTGLPNMHIIYAITFDEDGTLYAIGADAGDDGGPASLYTIDLDNVQSGSFGSQTVPAQKVAEIKSPTNHAISTNWIQDMAFDYATGTLYWMENDEEILYIVDTTSAVATSVGKLPTLQSFCIPYDTAFEENKHMVSVICEGAGTVTSGDENKTFYMVDSGNNLTLTLTPDTGSGLRYVKVDGQNVSLDGLLENGYALSNITNNHVIEVGFKLAIPAEQNTIWWFHYQGYPASFYTQHHAYKFYELPNRINPSLDDLPRNDYVQTLLDKNGQVIDDDEIIRPGDYDVHVTHPGNDKYAALDVTYSEALQLAKCDGTPGRPVVYGKVGCKQGDLVTTSALQDYYGADGTLIDAAHDEIPVTLVWQNPETTYNEVGNFYASATIYAGELSDRILACYNDDDGNSLYKGKQISSRATQVVVLPADEASLIKVQASDASGGTVSGKGVYKNGDTVTVTATVNSNAGFTFGGWQEDGEVVSRDATYTFNAGGDRTLTAVFETKTEYRVILKTDPQDGGIVTGGGSYAEVTDPQATVTATPNQGYYFIGWYEGETLKSEQAEYTFDVEQEGIALTARFDIDYLARAEQAQENFESAVSTDAFEWQTLLQAVETYEAAADFVKNPPSGIQNAETRYTALTTYYNGVKALDLSDQGIGSADLAKLDLFTGVTDLNLSGTGVSNLDSLSVLENLETLDISGTGLTTLDTLVDENGKLVTPNLKTLTAQKLTLNSISALVGVISADGFDKDTIEKWDFTGSTLPDTEENRNDVTTIQGKLGNKFLPPTIRTSEPETPPVTPVIPSGSDKDDDDDGYSVSVPASSSIRGGAVSVSPRRADKGDTVTITVTPDDGYELDTLTATDSKGSELTLTNKGNGRYTFTMPGSSVKIQVSFRKTAAQAVNPFTDVSTGAYYYDAVLWAVANGVTNGTTATTFSPNATVTRAQMVTFLWRAHGAPRATGSNPFTDVNAGAYYYDAVLWAVANGVTNGTTATTFSPNAPVTRAQAVTFQWRTAGSPAVSGGSFSDVAASAYYSGAVAWAVANGITNGTTATTFSPDTPVSRAQAVTFLWRELA